MVAPLDRGTIGNFHGLIDRHTVLNGNLASKLQITTTTSGLYSGRIITGEKSNAFTGRLIAAPGHPTQATLRSFIPSLNMTLEVVIDGSTNVLSGTVTDLSSNTTTVNGWGIGRAQTVDYAADVESLFTFYLEQPLVDPNLPGGYGFGSFVINRSTGALTVSGRLADGSRLVSSTFVGQQGQMLL